MPRISDVAVCRSSASARCVRASASSRACRSSCVCRSASAVRLRTAAVGAVLRLGFVALRRRALPALSSVLARRFIGPPRAQNETKSYAKPPAYAMATGGQTALRTSKARQIREAGHIRRSIATRSRGARCPPDQSHRVLVSRVPRRPQPCEEQGASYKNRLHTSAPTPVHLASIAQHLARRQQVHHSDIPAGVIGWQVSQPAFPRVQCVAEQCPSPPGVRPSELPIT